MSDFPATVWTTAARRYRSFDGGTRIETRCFAPDRYRFWDTGSSQVGISRGAGLSYSPASFSKSVPSVEHSRFNRLLDFDSDGKILEVESGVTLGQIYQFAERRGLFLSVQPGHPKITVGGCVGADVHGKNQFRDGTFLAVVESLCLFHPNHGLLELSRSSNADMFFLTCGGYGLTGNILTARLRLTPVASPNVRLEIVPIRNIFDFAGDLANAAAQNELVYSWHDFTARGAAFGRGMMVIGNFAKEVSRLAAPATSRSPRNSVSRLDSATRGLMPFSLFNGVTTPIFNHMYHAWFQMTSSKKLISLYEFLFPVHNKEAYFYWFGAKGFHECQIIVDAARFNSFVSEIQRRLERHPVAVTLASAKLFRGQRKLIRFTGDGICLTLNFPRDQAGAAFARFMDDLMLKHGGWPNLIKDSRLTADVVNTAYPECEQFRERLRAFDPRRLYRSELSDRIRL
jgi:decaprenylphospho-beta-D-ribofuranose 2-oxidase